VEREYPSRSLDIFFGVNKFKNFLIKGDVTKGFFLNPMGQKSHFQITDTAV
jgi:hypothetical protein